MTNPEERLLSPDERLQVSLVSEYPLSKVENVIVEASKHQDGKSYSIGYREGHNTALKEVEFWLDRCGLKIIHTKRRDYLQHVADETHNHYPQFLDCASFRRR